MEELLSLNLLHLLLRIFDPFFFFTESDNTDCSFVSQMCENDLPSDSESFVCTSLALPAPLY